ncbi:F-box/FBD/LRR-repeat protein [Trifolium repens]|nr:F-box/FBD/LRR-repeat protein [Trifolium repens]
MTQSIKMANCVDHIDRISDLPGNVIDGILKHLKIPELVRTSILSTKWRYMWKSVPELEFCYNFFNRFRDLDDPDPEISRIITEVLSFHNGPIHRISLKIPYLFDFTITTEYLSKWLPFLSRRGIKDLELLNYSPLYYNKMPSDIFSCQDLTYFRCSGFNLSLPPDFCGLKKLLDLYLEYNAYEFGALQNLISGCPLLENLSIKLSGDMKPVCLKKAKNLIDLSITIDQEAVSGLIKSLPKIQKLLIHSYIGKVRKQHL